jgi:hypothetical protein
MSAKNKDGVRVAAAVLAEDVAKLAGDLALVLRSDAELEPAGVAALMVEAGRVQKRLQRHQARLGNGDA